MMLIAVGLMLATGCAGRTLREELTEREALTHREELLRDGVTVFPNAVPPSLLARIRNASTALIESDATRHLQRDQFTGSLIPVTKDEAFGALLGFPVDLLEAMGLGADSKFLSGYVISKPPSSPSLGWHQDAWYWDDAVAYGEAPTQLFAMYYLTDTTRENGCLRAIPGSHRREHALHGLLGAAHSEAVRADAEWRDAPAHRSWPDEVDVAVNAGDLVIGDARLLHSAHPNESADRRTVVTIWHMPDYASHSRTMRDRTERLHLQLAAELYTEWPPASLEAAYLPISDSVDVVKRRQLQAQELERDEFDHSLDGMVRTPGWTRTHPASSRAWDAATTGGTCATPKRAWGALWTRLRAALTRVASRALGPTPGAPARRT